MNQQAELLAERAYTAHVQQLLYAVIRQYKGYSDDHNDSIRMMLSDAWEELRMKPTALSPQDLEQLSTEVTRILARQAFTNDLADRYERMLLVPFFGRIDFMEAGEKSPDRIVIGLYSLSDQDGNLLVHDWRAPICSLYYDATPGEAAYESPSGQIRGKMTLKRQYRMENGKLQYFVDTDLNIEDDMLLDILSHATSSHMRTIVSTIQREQNAAIRYDNVRVLSVVGVAGSGKTAVAMHRASYLLYKNRDLLDAGRIAVLSPSGAFAEYISTVLPDLGEENVQTLTIGQIFKKIIGHESESPVKQNEVLLAAEPDSLRRVSVHYKSSPSFSVMLERFANRFHYQGPEFSDIGIGKRMLMSKDELTRLYRVEYRLMNPALRLVRIQTVLTSRLAAWEKALREQYEERLFKAYRGRDLEMAVNMAVSQHLRPVKASIRRQLEISPLQLYARALADAPDGLDTAAAENAEAKLIWFEDAPGIAWLMLNLGFTNPDKQLMHLLVDEAQDYPDIALRALRLYFSSAKVTLLGDPNQRTGAGLPNCKPEEWGACFGDASAPVVSLTKCYRSTQPITRLCNAILPETGKLESYGRDSGWPMVAAYDPALLQNQIETWRARDDLRLLAIATRTQAEAEAIAKRFPDCTLLTGGKDDTLPETRGLVVGSYHLLKGLEFDGVVVVWPDAPLDAAERRRLYTACSRALHELSIMVSPNMVRALGIVL